MRQFVINLKTHFWLLFAITIFLWKKSFESILSYYTAGNSILIDFTID